MKKLTHTAKKMLSRGFLASTLKVATPVLLVGTAITYMSSAQAAINKNQVNQYAQNMRQAANSQNIGRIAELVSDDAIISLSGNGKKTSLNKNGYLKLLQRNWNKTSNYKYTIQISNIVIIDDEKASAKVTTKESYLKNGKSFELITKSDAKFSLNNNKVVLLRSVAQVTTKQ